MKITLSTYEFLKKFSNQKSARTYLKQRRWKSRILCPCCNSVERTQTRKVEGYYRCLCKSDTVRIIFERSHVALDKWLYTMCLMVTSCKRISSLQLFKELKVIPKTAWSMLEHLREACGNNKDLVSLVGVTEANENRIGGKETTKHESKKFKAGSDALDDVAILSTLEHVGDAKVTVLLNTKSENLIGATS